MSTYHTAYDHMDGKHAGENFNEICYECWRNQARLLSDSNKAFQKAFTDALEDVRELRSKLAAPKDYQAWVHEARLEGLAQARSDYQVKLDEVEKRAVFWQDAHAEARAEVARLKDEVTRLQELLV